MCLPCAICKHISHGDKNYVPHPTVELTGGSSPGSVTAAAIISHGRVIGIRILARNGSYQVGD